MGKADHLEARMAALQAESASQQVVAAALQPEAVAESASQQVAAVAMQPEAVAESASQQAAALSVQD